MPKEPTPINTRPCRRCGKEIFMVRTKDGKEMPLDAERTEVWLVDAFFGQYSICGRYKGHVSHWSTCPHADDFRKDPQK